MTKLGKVLEGKGNCVLISLEQLFKKSNSVKVFIGDKKHKILLGEISYDYGDYVVSSFVSSRAIAPTTVLKNLIEGTFGDMMRDLSWVLKVHKEKLGDDFLTNYDVCKDVTLVPK